MSRFVIGDDLGSLKVLHVSEQPGPSASRVDLKSVYQSEASLQGQTRIAVQALAHLNTDNGVLIAAAFSDGNLRLSRLADDDTLEHICSWKETRLKTNRFVGLALTDSAVFSCTSNGILRRATYSEVKGSDDEPQQSVRALPTRLCDWKLSPNGDTFAYGGEEVPPSLWSVEKAFQEPQQSQPAESSTSKKRKRNDALFPGEIWRAKNLPNDSLSLRQPIRITALNFLPGSSRDFVVGTQSGSVQRYETRASRRPVADWKNLTKQGGVRVLSAGCNANELFVGDNGSNFYSVDLRTGAILYGYHGIASSVTSIAVSPDLVISGALDQYARIHSTVAPPLVAKDRLDKKGAVLEKHFLQCTPTSIIWDSRASTTASQDDDGAGGESDHDVWEELEEVSDSEVNPPKSKRRLNP